ncbi:MAG: ABC-type transport system involved in cytochrome c biogenesis permease subunit [Planctomycetota bacterium]|jgi:ABC-type transport system involved in cytochrome c biogenesis permease subunit
MRKLANFFASYGLAVGLLFLLFLLTLFGTLEQQYEGLYEVQKKYFNSLYLIHDLGPIPLPLPGAVTVLTLLAFNLLLGGFIRIRKTAATAGVLVVHVGMAMMLMAGLVKLTVAEEGHLTLYEGERSDEYVSYYEWEVAIFDFSERNDIEEFIVGHEDVVDLIDGRVGKFSHPDLPFDFTLSHFVPNARPMPKGPMWETTNPVVDGYALKRIPLDETAERNVAGIYIGVGADTGGEEQFGILSGVTRAPHVFEAGGKQWGAKLRHRSFPMGFTILLDEFTHEMHPGTGMPSRFLSDVTMVTEEDKRPLIIEMNEPLREGGLVLFQSSWGPSNARPGDPLFSTFSVVNNPSDHWPLYSLIITGVGMGLVFMTKLLAYIKKQGKARMKKSNAAVDKVAQAAGLLLAVCCLPLLLSAAAPQGHSGPQGHGAPKDVRIEAWSPEILELAEELTIQAGGRVKPLSTYAAFQLLKTNGKRKVITPDEVTLNPTEWILDSMFFPEMAKSYEIFLVEDSDVLIAAGIEGKKRRDRYSYNELLSGRKELVERARATSGKADKDLSSLERQTRALAANLMAFDDLTWFLDFARLKLAAGDGPGMARVYPGAEILTLSQLLAKAGELRGLWATTQDPVDQQTATKLTNEIDFYVKRGGYGLAMIAPNPEWSSNPPPEGHEDHAVEVEEEDTYLTPMGMMTSIFASKDPANSMGVRMIALFEMLFEQRNQPVAFAKTLGAFHAQLKEAAEARDEFALIPMEVSFYKRDYFYNSLAIYLLSFILLGVSWLRPSSKMLQKAVWACILGATGMLITGIVFRCILRSRPPISTLYETILFITACSVLVALFIEYFNRQRVALAVASVMGALGVFLSTKYELKEAVTAGDTMPSLVAVLDTNFWLATHVTTVSMGYSAGLLAAAMAHVWILGKAFGLKKGDREFYRGLTRMIYGIICFGLFFSLVGTVLGGIWANYSWGRFWGWDPKENGALLIVLSMLMMLHARLGGHIKQFGICMSSVVCGLVVSFSWWGVNLLGIGLHSYGFTSGIFTTLVIFFGIEGLVLLIGLAWWMQDRAVTRAKAELAAGV